MLICINVIPQRESWHQVTKEDDTDAWGVGGTVKEVHCANASAHPLGSMRRVARRA